MATNALFFLIYSRESSRSKSYSLRMAKNFSGCRTSAILDLLNYVTQHFEAVIIWRPCEPYSLVVMSRRTDWQAQTRIWIRFWVGVLEYRKARNSQETESSRLWLWRKPCAINESKSACRSRLYDWMQRSLKSKIAVLCLWTGLTSDAILRGKEGSFCGTVKCFVGCKGSTY